MHILAINPGGGSTRVAVFKDRKQVFSETIQHTVADLARFRQVIDQYAMRRDAVLKTLKKHNFDTTKLNAIVTRGGPLLPMPSGVYRITNSVVYDIHRGRYQTMHPSLLGPLIAHELATQFSVPAWFVDPESTDEFRPEARFTGIRGLSRRALSHALSCRTVCEAAARKLRKPADKCRFVVAHLGTGITIAARVNGRQVDATNANDEGPFSPQRAGSLPSSALVDLCFSGRHTRATILELTQRRGGLISHLGTDDIRKVEALIEQGHQTAKMVFDAMIYQIAKEIGAYVVACGDTPDAIVLTGGLTCSTRLVNQLKRWIARLAPKIIVFPGEEEMTAMATRLLEVLEGREKEKDYDKETALRR
ncbi:MAG: butyrate kinase [candidate division WOR-3 bacterium]